ncbi:hypothetical protein PYS58_11465 [Chryseobacterium indologenes]|uniref:hypothetical protein n=2 Tax=Chryseobacterium group TaxID=2782232 RepID=UPI0023E8F813|nr:hypothetical protein [Chryseobacterium indologenes]WET51738.1 hypothetical protein PYS58_11465 [Chryseobacterium indologenes]
MKKIYRLIVSSMFILYGALVIAQDNNNSIQKKNIVAFPTSANAYAIDKVGKLAVDMFKGKANINIPFYTINVDGVSIPISLSYNTGGIKLNEIASTVGLGWSLNIPSNISQNIIDKDDKTFSMYTKDINVVNSNFRSVGIYDNDIRQIIDDHYEGIYDTRPDLFNYSLPFGGGSFIFNNDIGYTIPHEDLMITGTNNKKNIKIVNTDGAIYFLSIKNNTSMDSNIPGSTTSSSETLYQIDSIRTITNKKILFEYTKSYYYSEKSITERANIDISDEVSSSADLPINLPNYERYVGTIGNREKLITKIIFPEGTVYFNYSNDGFPFSDGTSIRKDILSNDGVALRQILVKDKYGKIIKDYNLNFSYFTSNSGTDYQNYRLKLLNIYDSLQKNYYKFYYNENIPFPARNSNNDDYWGYINSTTYSENSTNIPDKIYTDYTSKNITLPAQYTRNRDTNPDYTSIGILNRIEYPTGGSKYLYYENATKFFTRTNYQWGYTDNFATVMSQPSGNGGSSDNFGNISQTITIPPTYFDGKESPKIKLIFGNTCENNVDDETSQIHDTSCYGNATSNGGYYGTNGKPAVFELNNVNSPINISLSRTGKCSCGYAVDVVYGQYTTINSNIPIGGLRIKKIKDLDNNSFVNTYNYKYDVLDKATNTYKSSGILNMPFQYTTLLKRYVTQAIGGGELAYPYIQKYLVVNNSSTNYNSYGSSDVLTYKQVTEYNELGQNINIFSQINNSDSDKMYTHVYSNYNDWKNGLLEKNIILNKLNDTMKVTTHKYAFNYLKNPKAGFITGTSDQIGFALNLDIVKYLKRVTVVNENPIYVNIYPVTKEIIGINSAKLEHIETTTKEFFGDKSVVTKVLNNYWDTDINKPFNVKSTENIFPSGESVKTEYQYAHQTGNQLLIDKNMIATPLETETRQTINGVTNVLSKSKTIYPTALPTSQTGNLALPMSILSYDIQNPSVVANEVIYDKYDSKGNIVQYTTKDGVSTVIIWGYNGTQPIAKIENAKLENISQSFIDSIVNASNTDASAERNNDETNLLNAFNTFKNNLSGYQITTYSYDPLIGVRSITPPSGIREVYLYDAAGRLKEVRENNQTGKLLKEFNYHYKN